MKTRNISSRSFSLSTSLAATEEDALAPLPRFNTKEEERGLDEDNAPFPADSGVFEDDMVDDGDIEQGEDGDEPGHDGPEEELVAPHVVHPLGEVFLGAGLHAEEAETHVNHFPREEKGEPGEADEGRGAGAEDRFAFW